jgi:hypothetical protein
MFFFFGTVSNVSEETQDTQVSITEDDTTTNEHPPRKKMKLYSSSDAQIAELLKESINQRNANEKMLEQDEDRHFFFLFLEISKESPSKEKWMLR